jgi:YHS domain-containing protein
MARFLRRSLVFLGLAAALEDADAFAQAGSPPGGGQRVALKGYDPVSYFSDGKPEQGSKDFTFAFDDTTYWFKSAEHRDLFAADPERYAPQFDGYCAMQLSRSVKAEADPQAWTIINGKLYVFAGKPGVEKFRHDAMAIAEKAKENWQQVRRQ